MTHSVRFFRTSIAGAATLAPRVLLAAFVGVAAFVFGPAGARADTPAFSGRWSATAMRVDWKIGDWGSPCGPRPSGGGTPGGAVTIQQSGSELTLSGTGRSYSTSECWEQFPGLVRVGHTTGPRSWRTICKTPPGDPRQATVVTTLTATSDAQLSFDETGQYQFVLEGQNCTASVRRTRMLTRIPAAVAPTAAPSSPAPKPSAPPARAARCATTGLPERLEVRPSRKLMRPGESFTFRASVVDRAGCPLPITPTWRVVAGTNAVQLDAPGKISIHVDAAESEARLQAAVGDRAVAVVVEIVSRDRYDALLREGSFNAEGESTEAAVARIATESIGTRGTIAREDARGRRLAFVAIVGTLALGLGTLGLLLVRRSRKQRRSALALQSRAAVALPEAPKSSVMLCPTCREEFPPDATFCAFDGNRLVPLVSGRGVGPTGGICPVCGQGYDPGVTTCPKHNEPLVPALVAERRRPAVTHRICPVCGTQFPGDSQFCGTCGAALVPVN